MRSIPLLIAEQVLVASRGGFKNLPLIGHVFSPENLCYKVLTVNNISMIVFIFVVVSLVVLD